MPNPRINDTTVASQAELDALALKVADDEVTDDARLDALEARPTSSDTTTLDARLAAIEAVNDHQGLMIASLSDFVAELPVTGGEPADLTALTTRVVATENVLAGFKAVLLGTALPTGATGGGGVIVPPPIVTGATVDPQPLPLTMEPVATPNATVEKGTGPDEFIFRLSPNVWQAEFDVLVLFPDGSGRKIANNFLLEGPYSVKGQEFSLRGVFGPNAKFKIVGSGNLGLPDLYVVSAQYNGAVYYIFGDYDSRSDVYVIDAASTYNSEQDQEILIGPWQEPDPSTLPPPPAVLSLINGKTLEQLVADATAETLLEGGVIYGTCLVKAGLALRGAGRDSTIIDLTNGSADVREKFDKAGVVLAAGAEVSDLTVQDATISESLGQNAAGLRNEAGGAFTAKRITLKGNQNGVLTNAETDGTLRFEDVNLDGNGARRKDGSIFGNTHQMYIGGVPSLILELVRVKTITPSRDVHEIKCRAGRSFSTDCDLIAGDQGAAWEFPNGGTHVITGGSTAKMPGAANINLMVIGMENDNNGAYLPSVSYVSHRFKSSGIIQNGPRTPDAKLSFDNCTKDAGVVLDVRGFKPENVTGLT